MVFIPLSDDNPLRSIRFQWVTVGLIAANALAFLWQNGGLGETAAASFALIPTELFQVRVFGGSAHGPLDTLSVPEGYTLLTYQFLHGDIFHLLSNMIFLWVFGDNIEDAMGHLKFLVFYLACGVAGGLAHAWMLPVSKLPLIGASGAVAGVIAAYLILHPRVRVWVLAFRIIPLRITAAWVLGIWVATQIVMVVSVSCFGSGQQANCVWRKTMDLALGREDMNVAFWAHIGGMVAGAVLILFMRRPGVPLFDRGLTPV